MTTAKHAEANRQNALRSTGPKTDEGRERAKMNALKHGLAAETVIMAAERAEDYEAFRDAMFEDLAPVGTLEGVLVERIVVGAWRLRRAVRKEAGVDRGKRARAKRVHDNLAKEIAQGKIWYSGGLADPHGSIKPVDSLSWVPETMRSWRCT